MGKSSSKIPPSHRPSSLRGDAPAHRPLALKDWHVLIFLGVLLAILFRTILAGTAFFWEDFLYQNYPFRNFAATSLAAGDLPLWNPYTFDGMPFLADIQTTVFYLPSLLLTLFVSGGRLNFYWLELVIILHFFLAGVSMYYLARSFALERIPSLFAGAAYMLSGFMVAHAIHQQMVGVVAWAPLILLLFRKTLADPRGIWVFLGGLVLGHSILAGFPQLSLYFYTFFAAFVVFELVTTYPGRKIISPRALSAAGRVAAIFLLSLGVAALQLLPTMELSPLSQRAEITYQKATEGSLAWEQILTFLYPKFFGTSTSQEYRYWGPGPYWHYWETCVYLGALPLLLGILASTSFRRSKYVVFFLGAAVFALLFALGGNMFVHRLFFSFVPGFSLFRNPARIGILVAFAFALLSAFSLDRILYREQTARSRKTQRTIVLTISGAALLVWLFATTGALTSIFPFLRDPRILETVRSTTAVEILVIILSAGLVTALVLNRWKITLAGPLLLIVLLADITQFGGGQFASPLSPDAYFSRAVPLTSFLRQEGKSEIFRVNTRAPRGMILDRNQGMVDRIFMMEGYTPLALQRVYPPMRSGDQMLDLLNIKYKTVVDDAGSARLVPHPTYLPRAFFVYDICVVQSEAELRDTLQSPTFNHRTTAVLEQIPLFRPAVPADPPKWSATITGYSNTLITLDVTTSVPGLLMLSETYYPGWRAYVDGDQTDIYRTDYSLRSLCVPAGSHRIEVRFQPESFFHGVLISITTCLLCAAGIGLSLFRSLRLHNSGQEKLS